MKKLLSLVLTICVLVGSFPAFTLPASAGIVTDGRKTTITYNAEITNTILKQSFSSDNGSTWSAVQTNAGPQAGNITTENNTANPLKHKVAFDAPLAEATRVYMAITPVGMPLNSIAWKCEDAAGAGPGNKSTVAATLDYYTATGITSALPYQGYIDLAAGTIAFEIDVIRNGTSGNNTLGLYELTLSTSENRAGLFPANASQRAPMPQYEIILTEPSRVRMNLAGETGGSGVGLNVADVSWFKLNETTLLKELINRADNTSRNSTSSITGISNGRYEVRNLISSREQRIPYMDLEAGTYYFQVDRIAYAAGSFYGSRTGEYTLTIEISEAPERDIADVFTNTFDDSYFYNFPAGFFDTDNTLKLDKTVTTPNAVQYGINSKSTDKTNIVGYLSDENRSDFYTISIDRPGRAVLDIRQFNDALNVTEGIGSIDLYVWYEDGYFRKFDADVGENYYHYVDLIYTGEYVFEIRARDGKVITPATSSRDNINKRSAFYDFNNGIDTGAYLISLTFYAANLQNESGSVAPASKDNYFQNFKDADANGGVYYEGLDYQAPGVINDTRSTAHKLTLDNNKFVTENTDGSNGGAPYEGVTGYINVWNFTDIYEFEITEPGRVAFEIDSRYNPYVTIDYLNVYWADRYGNKINPSLYQAPLNITSAGTDASGGITRYGAADLSFTDAIPKTLANNNRMYMDLEPGKYYFAVERRTQGGTVINTDGVYGLTGKFTPSNAPIKTLVVDDFTGTTLYKELRAENYILLDSQTTSSKQIVLAEPSRVKLNIASERTGYANVITDTRYSTGLDMLNITWVKTHDAEGNPVDEIVNDSKRINGTSSAGAVASPNNAVNGLTGAANNAISLTIGPRDVYMDLEPGIYVVRANTTEGTDALGTGGLHRGKRTGWFTFTFDIVPMPKPRTIPTSDASLTALQDSFTLNPYDSSRAQPLSGANLGNGDVTDYGNVIGMLSTENNADFYVINVDRPGRLQLDFKNEFGDKKIEYPDAVVPKIYGKEPKLRGETTLFERVGDTYLPVSAKKNDNQLSSGKDAITSFYADIDTPGEYVIEIGRRDIVVAANSSFASHIDLKDGKDTGSYVFGLKLTSAMRAADIADANVITNYFLDTSTTPNKWKERPNNGRITNTNPYISGPPEVLAFKDAGDTGVKGFYEYKDIVGYLNNNNIVDYYEFTLDEPGRMYLRINPNHNPEVSLNNYFISWADGNGDKINPVDSTKQVEAIPASISDQKLNAPSVTYMDLEKGTYHILIENRNQSKTGSILPNPLTYQYGYTTGVYKLSSVFVPSKPTNDQSPATSNGTRTTAQLLEWGQTVRSHINGITTRGNNNDWYKVEIDDPGELTINLSSSHQINGVPWLTGSNADMGLTGLHIRWYKGNETTAFQNRSTSNFSETLYSGAGLTKAQINSYHNTNPPNGGGTVKIDDPGIYYFQVRRSGVGYTTSTPILPNTMGNTGTYTISANYKVVGIHIPVTGIENMPTTATANIPLELPGADDVRPVTATNKDIVWTVIDAGTTGATIVNNVLNTTAGGTVVVQGTIANGLSETTAWTTTRSITISTVHVPVTDILNLPHEAIVGIDLSLSGTVMPLNASAKLITWSVLNQGTTGATITPGTNILKTTNAGMVTVRATIANGASSSTPYTKDFDIKVEKQYTVKIFSSGTGASGNGNYFEEQNVTINAGTAPAGMDFKNWIASSDLVVFEDFESAITSFKMPAVDVDVTAVFTYPPATVTSVTVSGPEQVQVGTQRRYTAVVAGTNGPSQAVTWNVSGHDTGGTTEITENGWLIVDDNEIGGTELTITATSIIDGYTDKYDEIIVTVTADAPIVEVTSVTVTPATYKVNRGDVVENIFSASVNGTNAPQDVTWSIVTVAVKAGTTIEAETGKLTIAADEALNSIVIRATSQTEGFTDKFGTATVTVDIPPEAHTPVESIVANIVSTMTTGGTFNVPAATVYPANASYKTVVWEVTNGTTGQATYNSSTGVLTAISAGTVTLTARIVNGTAIGVDKTQSYTITINAPVVAHGLTSVTVNSPDVNIPQGGATRQITLNGSLSADITYTIGAFLTTSTNNTPDIKVTSKAAAATSRTVNMVFPANGTASTISPRTYNIRVSVDDGATWLTGSNLRPSITQNGGTVTAPTANSLRVQLLGTRALLTWDYPTNVTGMTFEVSAGPTSGYTDIWTEIPSSSLGQFGTTTTRYVVVEGLTQVAHTFKIRAKNASGGTSAAVTVNGTLTNAQMNADIVVATVPHPAVEIPASGGNRNREVYVFGGGVDGMRVRAFNGNTASAPSATTLYDSKTGAYKAILTAFPSNSGTSKITYGIKLSWDSANSSTASDYNATPPTSVQAATTLQVVISGTTSSSNDNPGGGGTTPSTNPDGTTTDYPTTANNTATGAVTAAKATEITNAATANNGGTITVTMGTGNTSVPKSILTNIAGKNINLSLTFANAGSVIINGRDVNSTIAANDLNIQLQKTANASGTIQNYAIPQTAVNTKQVVPVQKLKIGSGNTAIAGTAAINVGSTAANQTAMLCTYNASTGKFQLVSSGTVAVNGNVNLNFKAAGDYVVIVRQTGDITGTGKVESADALELLKAVVGATKLDPIQEFVASAKHDGNLSTSDALNILKLVVGAIKTL